MKLSDNQKQNIVKDYLNGIYCHKYKYKLLEPYISNDILQTE